MKTATSKKTSSGFMAHLKKYGAGSAGALLVSAAVPFDVVCIATGLVSYGLHTNADRCFKAKAKAEADITQSREQKATEKAAEATRIRDMVISILETSRQAAAQAKAEAEAASEMNVNTDAEEPTPAPATA